MTEKVALSLSFVNDMEHQTESDRITFQKMGADLKGTHVLTCLEEFEFGTTELFQ